MENKNMSQAQIGKTLEMLYTGYLQYELGINDIPTSILKKPAALYNTNTDYIFELTDEPKLYPKYK